MTDSDPLLNDKPLPVVMSLHGKGGGSRGSLPVFERIRKQKHNIQSVLYAHPAETGRGLEDVKNAVLGVLDLEMRVRGWRGPQMEIGSIDSSDWKEGGDARMALGMLNGINNTEDLVKKMLI